MLFSFVQLTVGTWASGADDMLWDWTRDVFLNAEVCGYSLPNFSLKFQLANLPQIRNIIFCDHL